MVANENQKFAQELDAAAPLKTYLVSDDPAVLSLVEKYLEKIKKFLSFIFHLVLLNKKIMNFKITYL